MQRNSFRFTLSRTAFVALIAWGTLSAAPAHAFSDDEARQAILGLRAQLNQSNAQLSAAQRAILDLQNRFDQAQQQLATVRGQNEDMANQLATVQTSLKDYYADLDGRLKKLEPQQSTVDGVQGTVQPGETDAFNAALQQFRGGDYKNARAGFDDFVNKYPQSPNRPNALFWLGNAYFALGDYARSTQTLKSIVDAYPTHPRAPEALLSIATNQITQRQTSAARKTLQQILTQYGSSPSAQSAQEQLNKLK